MNPKTILFQGDSITDVFRDRANDESLGSGYPLLVSAALGFEAPDAYRFINRGVSGDKIEEVYARRNADLFELQPDYMSLLIGVNDVWHRLNSNIPLDLAQFERTYDALLCETREKLPQTKLMLLEPFVLRGTGTDDCAEMPDRFSVFSKNVRDVAAVVRSLAKRYALVFVPLQEAFDSAAKSTTPSYWLYDGVHPTCFGHELIKRAWLKAFAGLLNECMDSTGTQKP